MSESTPLVSAIITTHNRAELLPRALRSVIYQDYEPLEIIVVDDASTDDTEQVVRNYQRGHAIRYLKNEKSCGPANARNRAIEMATGTFIAGLDDDDSWHPERISMLMQAYSNDFAFATSDACMKYARGESVWKKEKIITLKTLLFTNRVGNQVLVRRNRLRALGGYDGGLAAIEDYDLWVRLCAAYGPVRNVQYPLQTIYMNHQKNRKTDRSFRGFLQFYLKHKARMTLAQREYQLFAIRRMQAKPVTRREFFSLVPPFRYWDEFKKIAVERLWAWKRA